MNDSDPQITNLLEELHTPEHGPDFWDALERELDLVAPPKSRRVAPWLLAAAAISLVVIGVVAALASRESGTGAVDTIGTADQLPSLVAPGTIEGPFPWAVQSASNGELLVLSRLAQPEEQVACRDGEVSETPNVFELLTLDLAGDVPEVRSIGTTTGQRGVLFERFATSSSDRFVAFHSFCDGPTVLNTETGESFANSPPVDAPRWLGAATWFEQDGELRLATRYFDFDEDDPAAGQTNRVNRITDPETGEVLSEVSGLDEPALLAVLDDGTRIEHRGPGSGAAPSVLVDGSSIGRLRTSVLPFAAVSPDGTHAAILDQATASEFIVVDGEGDVIFAQQTPGVSDFAWLPDGRLALASSDPSIDPSNLSIVDLSSPEPVVTVHNFGIGPISVDSLTYVTGGRLAVSGETRLDGAQTWFIPVPSSDVVAPEDDGDIASTSEFTDELALLIPEAEDLGPDLNVEFFEVLPPDFFLFDPNEEGADCPGVGPIGLLSGFLVFYARGNVPEQGFALAIEGTAEEVAQNFQNFRDLFECQGDLAGDEITFTPATVDGAVEAMTIVTDEGGEVNQGIFVNFGERLLVVTLEVQNGGETVDLVAVINDRVQQLNDR